MCPTLSDDRIDRGRHESVEERADRNLMELLQELRVAAIGIQVLFGFLLSLPFSARFVRLDAAQKQLYIICVVLAALAIGLLSAPVAYHRAVFRQDKKERLVQIANGLALAGLCVVALDLSFSVLLVTGVVFRGAAVLVVSISVLCMFGVLWFVVPLFFGRLTPRNDGRD